MGFRMRKSIKVAPGVRFNISKSGVGASAGVRGARKSIHSSGRSTTMLGDPIFGVGYMSQSGGTRKSRTQPRPEATPASPSAPARPGLLAPKAEKRLWKATVDQNADEATQVGEEFPEYRTAAYSIAAWLSVSEHPELAKGLLSEAFQTGEDPAASPFIQKYVRSLIELMIAPGVKVALPIGRDAIGLLLAELQQDADELDRAIETVEHLEPSAPAAVSLAELYSQSGRHDEVIELTNHLENVDDATALLLVYRGIALRETGYLDGSLEAFKEALRPRSRDSVIRNLAYSERARTYVAQGKKAMARRDLERVLAADSSYEGVRDRLDELT